MSWATTVELVETQCWCGVVLAIPDSLEKQARRDGHKIFCPTGHTFTYRNTELSRLRRELDSAQTRAESWKDQAQAAERRVTGLKGQLTKERKRTEGGVCPRCNRSFVQLARHMKSKHPDWKAS